MCFEAENKDSVMKILDYVLSFVACTCIYPVGSEVNLRCCLRFWFLY